MACLVKHKGKEYTFEDFREYLKKGAIDDLINDNRKYFNDYARAISENKGKLPESGEISKTSKDISGNDLQSSAQPTSGHGETEQQASRRPAEKEPDGKLGKGAIPPEMFDLPFEPEPPDVTRLAHEDTEKLYEEMGGAGRVPRETKTDIELEKQADELIKNGYDFVGKANEVLNGESHFTDAEQVAFAKMVGALKAKLNNLDIHSPEFDKIQDRIELLSRASDAVGSEAGASFRARRMFMLNDDTLSDFIRQDKKSLNVDDLTDKQKEQNKKEHEDIQKAQQTYEDKIKDLEAENAKLKAEAALNQTKKSTTKGAKKTHEEYVKERKSYIDELKDLKAKADKELKDKGIQKMGVGFTFTPEMAKVVGKIVKSLAEEGVDKLEDFVKNIHGQLKGIFPDIEEKDVHNIIAGEYAEKNKPKSELTQKLQDLHDEAALINKLEALQRGEEPKSEKKKVERNQQITQLRKQIKDLPPGAKDLRTLKERNIAETKKIQENIAKGNFAPEEKKAPLWQNKELAKKFPQLMKEVLKSRDDLMKARKDRDIRLLKQQYAQRSKVRKGLDTIAELGNTPRAIMSSLDFSAPLRQGLWGVTKQFFSHPGDLTRQFGFMFKASTSQKIFDRWFQDLKEAPDYEIIKQSGLPIADPHDPKLAAKEEAFMSNYAEKIPAGIGKAIKASERAYVGFLNKMRVDIFRRGADTFASEGKTFENNPELYKAFADYVGAATGRGKMPDILEKSAPILNAAFFSPRLIASRMRLLTNWANPNFYTKIPKEIRVQYFKDLGKFIGLGMTILGIAKLGGADVEDDPRSSDFGKIKSGNTRWDIWGGFQQYVRLASQLFTGEKKSTTTGVTTELGGKGPYKQTRGDILLSFLRGKLAPVPGEALDLLYGKDVTGQPVTLGSEVLKNLPLVAQDIADAYQDRGLQGALGVGIPSLFGVGVQTYQPAQGGGSGGGGGAGGSYQPTIKEWQ